MAGNDDNSAEEESGQKALEQRAVTRRALVDLLKRGAASKESQVGSAMAEPKNLGLPVNAESAERAEEPAGAVETIANGEQIERSAEEKSAFTSLSESVELQRQTTIEEYADGSLIELDEVGNVIRVKDAKSEERSFGWDAAGRLVEVCLPFARWTTADGKTWTNNQGKTKTCIRKIDRDGTYWEEDESWRKLYKLDGTQVEVHKPGGSLNLLFKNGSTLSQHKQNGTVRQIRNADGSEYQYQVTEDGRLRPFYHKYAEPTRLEFATQLGIEVIDDIIEVNYDWLEDESTVKMTYKSHSGRRYVLERGRHGEFRSFTRL